MSVQAKNFSDYVTSKNRYKEQKISIPNIKAEYSADGKPANVSDQSVKGAPCRQVLELSCDPAKSALIGRA